MDVCGGGKALTGPCPIHGGDNLTAFAVYPEGNWRCWTAHCEDEFFGDAIGLVWGLLSAGKGRKAHFRDALDWAWNFLGALPAQAPDAAAARYGRAVDRLLADPPDLPGVDPALVAARLTVPSPYFLGRGFAAETLSTFGVGDPVSPPDDSLMRGRAVVPVFSPDGAKVVGYTGRSVYGKCVACDHYHPPGPCRRFPKWFHAGPTRGSPSFPAGDVLFGFDKARRDVLLTGRVVLVEGPGDTMALHEAGVRCVVGLFGTAIADGQVLLLENSGAMDVVVATNNDKAGREGAARIVARLGDSFRVKVVHPPAEGADWAETDAVVQKQLLGT